MSFGLFSFWGKVSEQVMYIVSVVILLSLEVIKSLRLEKWGLKYMTHVTNLSAELMEIHGDRKDKYRLNLPGFVVVTFCQVLIV